MQFCDTTTKNAKCDGLTHPRNWNRREIWNYYSDTVHLWDFFNIRNKLSFPTYWFISKYKVVPEYGINDMYEKKKSNHLVFLKLRCKRNQKYQVVFQSCLYGHQILSKTFVYFSKMTRFLDFQRWLIRSNNIIILE